MSKKVPISAEQSPLQSPFAALDIKDLPPGPDAPPISVRKQEKKAHRLVLRREKSNRGGKTVVVVSQLPTHLSPPEIENLCRDARKSLGCGGTVQGREIEIQGDQPDRVRTYFEKLGYVLVGP
ncbi:translation initiation factor [soil metagenome]